MRITFLSPFASLAGGVRVMAIYAARLQARGHEVTVVSQPGAKPTLKRRLQTALGLRERMHRPKGTPLLDVLGARHVVLDHDGPITADDVPDGDVVIATWWETAIWAAALPASKGRKFYLLQDYETFKKGRSEAVSATYELPLKKIAVSEYIAGMLAEHHGIADVDVVPNAVDLDQFQAPERARNSALTLGYVYTRKPRKNVGLAVEVLEQARAEIPGLRAMAFGSVTPLPVVPVPDWISFHHAPPQQEIARIYAACDLWLFTSLHEGFGLPILEAMACGTPVLATRAGAAPQLIDGVNGSLLEPDPEAFLSEIRRFAQMSPEAWRTASDAARATAASYSWEDATDRLLASISAAG